MDIDLLTRVIEASELAEKFEKIGGMGMLDVSKPCKHTDNYKKLIELCNSDERVFAKVTKIVHGFKVVTC